MSEQRTFKWGDQEYLVDDLLKLHAEQENNYYNFARDKGKYNNEALTGLKLAVTNRINSVKNGETFDADGTTSSDKVDNVSIRTKRGLLKKDKYVDQDNTEWAKYYLNTLVSKLTPHKKQKDTSGDWDINKYGLSAYLTGQGVNARDIFEEYDLYDEENPDNPRSYDQRHKALREHLIKYRDDLAKSNYDFTKNDNRWDDDFMDTLNNLIDNQDWSDSVALAAALRKLGAGDQYATAFTSDRWDLSKSDSDLKEDRKKKQQEKEEKQKSAYLDEWEDYSYDNYKSKTYSEKYYNPFDYSTYKFKKNVPANFRNWYYDANAKELANHGTFLKTDQDWSNAWNNLMTSFKMGTQYNDKNINVLLQGTFENAPNGFIDLGNGAYLIKESVTDSGLGTIYDPKSGYTTTIFLGDYANSNDQVKRLYEQLGYDYINKKYNTNYNNRPDVFEEGGKMISKYHYGDKVVYNWGTSSDRIKERAQVNNVSVQTQMAKDQYMDSDNKSVDNPNAGWNAKHYARLGSAVVDLSAAIAGFIPGGGTAYAAGAGLLSTGTNFITDLTDDAVTVGESFRNLGFNLGMDLLGLIPGGGAASKLGKIVRTLKNTAPLIIALPGVAHMLANSPEIAKSWKRAFDGEDGEKMNYQDYMNILQVLNTATGITNISTNVYKSAKKAPKKQDVIAVEVFDKKGNKKALVLEGDDVEAFKTANNNNEAQDFINKIEGGKDYTISEITTSNKGKFWGNDQNDKFHLFNQNPFGRTGTGKAKILNVRNETVTDFWERPVKNKKGKPQTRLYAETGRWDADLGLNKGELVYAKDKIKLDAWKKQQQADVENLIKSYRQKAEQYKTNIDGINRQLGATNSEITLNTNQKSNIDAEIAKHQRIINDSNAEANRIQDWLNNGGVAATQNKINTTQAEIDNLTNQKKNTRNKEKKQELQDKIDDLEQIKRDAERDLANYTPEAVLKYQEAANNSTTEQSKLQIETAKLEALLNNLNARKRNLTNISSKHSNEYDLIKNFKPVERVFNGDVHKFDVSSELKNLDNLFKQGGSINRNKLNKFLNYGKR